MRSNLSKRLVSCLCLAVGVLAVSGQPANDNLASRSVISGTNALLNADNQGASRETTESTYLGYLPGGASVWWAWTAPSDCVCTLKTAGSSFDTMLAVFTGTSYANLELVEYNDDYGSGLATSQLKFDAFAGVTYLVLVDGYEGAQGIIRLQLTTGPPIIGKPAPAWALRTTGGTMMRSTDFAGKVVILDFWATWCGPCKVEIPDFIALQNQYGRDGLVIIGASVDSTSGVVTQFVQTNTPAINYTILMADNAVQSAYGGIGAIPTTFIIDRNNVVRRKYVGTQSKDTFTAGIVPLLYGRLDTQAGPASRTMRWRVDGSPTLEHSPSLAPAAWTRWAQAPQQANGTNILQVPAEGTGFFRLRYAY